MAQKTYAGTVKNGRDSKSKRLGLKKFHNQYCKIGQIIIRQRGLKILPGKNIGQGKDFTLYALKSGILKFRTYQIKSTNKSYKKIDIFLDNWENLLNKFYYLNFLTFKKIFKVSN
jgi:large subunit ribosomal protein L27